MFYVAAVAAVLIIGISKSGFGGGLGVLGVPVMSLYVPPLKAAAILLPILCVMDVITVWIYRKSWDRTNIKILLPASLVGVVIGALTFQYLSEAHIRIIVGVIAVVFSLLFLLRRNNPAKRGPNLFRGSFWGLIAGFVSFGVHSGAPPANVYLLPQRLDKTIFVGTLAVLFAVIPADGPRARAADTGRHLARRQASPPDSGTAVLPRLLLPADGNGIEAALRRFYVAVGELLQLVETEPRAGRPIDTQRATAPVVRQAPLRASYVIQRFFDAPASHCDSRNLPGESRDGK